MLENDKDAYVSDVGSQL